MAYYHDWALKGSLGINYQSIGGEKATSDDVVGIGINTSFGYRWDQLEMALASYVTFGESKNHHFKVGDFFEGTADGLVRNVTFTPLLKFYTGWIPIPNRTIYISLGPSFGLRTFWPRRYTLTVGEIKEDYKITYQNNGFYGAIGIEELSTFKEENPTFFELMLGFTRAKKITIVDTTNKKKVKVVRVDKAGPNIRTIVMMLNLGITFF